MGTVFRIKGNFEIPLMYQLQKVNRILKFKIQLAYAHQKLIFDVHELYQFKF